ncbi:MAG: hypothetical protein RLZ98_3278 [Pseudomonadota bacterium]|jgi:hypothetical protein
MNTAAQLLWIETLLKALGGTVLVLAPISAARLLGLAVTPTGFWMRLLGAILIGIAAATWIEGAWQNGQGLGLAGCLAINLSALAMLVLMLSTGRAAPKPRGRISLWMLAALLTVLSTLQFLVLATR